MTFYKQIYNVQFSFYIVKAIYFTKFHKFYSSIANTVSNYINYLKKKLVQAWETFALYRFFSEKEVITQQLKCYVK